MNRYFLQRFSGTLKTGALIFYLGLLASCTSITPKPSQTCSPADADLWQHQGFTTQGLAEDQSQDRHTRYRFRWQHQADADTITWLGPFHMPLATLRSDSHQQIWYDDGHGATLTHSARDIPELSPSWFELSHHLSDLLPQLLQGDPVTTAGPLQITASTSSCFNGQRLPHKLTITQHGRTVGHIIFQQWKISENTPHEPNRAR